MNKQIVALGALGVAVVGYFVVSGDAGGSGGGLGDKVGRILGSPGGMPSTGVSSEKLSKSLAMPSYGYYPEIEKGAKSVVTPKMRQEFGARELVPGANKVYSPVEIVSAVTQPYIVNKSAYVAPTYNGVGGAISAGGGAYTSPTQKGAGGLTAKGAATKKKVAERKSRGYSGYSGGSKKGGSKTSGTSTPGVVG